MENIDITSGDDEAPAVTGRGLCMKCGRVSQPHVCPHGAKVMKRASKARMGSSKVGKTSAGDVSSANYKALFGMDADAEDEAPAPPLAMPAEVKQAAGEGASAFGVISTLLQQHSNLQALLTKQQQDTSAAEARESAANQAVKHATSELTRLQGEINKRDKTIAGQIKKLGKAPAIPKGKAAAAAAAPTASGLAPAKDGYLQLIDDMIQKNTNPSYRTEREVCFMTGNQAQAAGLPSSVAAGWFFDNRTPPTPWQPAWVAIADAVIISLETLGVVTKSSKGVTSAFTPTVGQTVSYSFGQHNYTVTVVNVPAPQAPAPPPPAPPAPPKPWQDDMLFSGNFFKLPNSYMDGMRNGYHFDAPDLVVSKSAEVAALAEQWSSYGQGFKYDANKCELWIKPDFFKLWLRTAKERKYNEARILMHGMRSQNYHLLAKDPSGFDFNFTRGGVKHWGLYAACSDHIASDYNASGSMTLPDGTGVIGLLLIKHNAGGAYEHYRLGSKRGGPSSFSVNDAYAIRDQLLWLPIGLAHAKCP